MKTTTSFIARLSVRACVGAAASALLLLATTGCGNKSADLRLTSLENKSTFRQQFSHAYVSKAEDGNTEIVLVSDDDGEAGDGTARVAAAGEGGAIAPTSGVRQVMHVRVLWRPSRGTKQSHPSFTNAGIHWYVVGGNAPTDVLEYSGAGFVKLSDTPLGTQVDIKNATVKPVTNPRCSLTDPVGPSKLTGTFFAARSSKRVSDLLEEVQAAAQVARAAEHAAATPN